MSKHPTELPTRRDVLKYAAAAAISGGISSQDTDYRSNGRAYGFFDCSASRYDIERSLPEIRENVHTPQDVELVLWDGDAPEVREPREAAGYFKYVLEARYAKSNRETARELGHIFNQTVHTPLYGERESFRGRVAYHEGGEWEFLDEK